MPRIFLSAFIATSMAAFPALAVEKKDVLTTYSDIAQAKYVDSLMTAQALQEAVDALLVAPSQDTLEDARAAWKTSRVPYMQTGSATRLWMTGRAV